MTYKYIPAKVVCTENDDEPRICNPRDAYVYDNLYVIGNEFAALTAVWAANEHDAFDLAADAGELAGLALDADTVREREKDGEGIMYCGDKGTPYDSIYAWIKTVEK